MAPLLKWYYNSRLGSVVELDMGTGWVYLHSGTGWHGPFDTHQAAIDYYTANQAANPGWKAPTGLGGNISNAVGAINNPVSDVTGAIAAATNTIVKLAMRVLEAAVGIVLLAIAANVILKQTTGVDVAGTAKRAGKKAAVAAAAA
jgi:hypothetical protein